MLQRSLSKAKESLARRIIPPLNVEALEAELRAVVDGEVRFDRQSRALYATDGSNYRMIPIGVVVPRSRDAVEAAVAACRRHRVPLVNRGGGTALAGQTCNTAVVLEFSKYLNRVLEIDPARRLARVQPGTILDDLRRRAEREHGLTFGPDPATHDHCTLGGMIGNNSCGIHSVMAGRTADNVEELEILTYDGVRMRVGRTSEAELARIIAAGGRRGEIYRALAALRDRTADLVRERYPRIPRRVSGFNLDELLPENGFHVARALVGTEGTCVTILEATLNLVESPPARSLLVLGYPDVFAAGDHIPQILPFGPVGLEGIDELLIHYMKKKNLHPQDVQLLPDGGGWLLVEFGGRDKEESDAKARSAIASLKKEKDAPSMKLFDDPAQEKIVWEIRESGLGATAFVPGLPLGWPGWEDAAVPPEKTGAYLREFKKLLDRYGYIASLYGHFGQGCIHCRISFDLFTHEGVQNYVSFIEEASDLVMKYGGSFSGEHGDGQSRAILLPKMFGEELTEAFREFKTIWDPEGKMNPGKVVAPYHPDENLRLGTGYSPWHGKTHFTFPEDGGSMSHAALRCVGVGKCRRTEEAFMCPSFLATREEKDTTRGRAHLLFEMFRGDFLRDGWRSREVLDSLELCLGCKGCKSECPVNVDLATCKSEFLSHYYEGRLRPRDAYVMGLIGWWGEAGSRLPALANLLSSAPGLSSLLKSAAGIHPNRQLPRFAAEPFTAWFRRRAPPAEATRGEVVLYPDPFNNFFYPGTLKAALDLLEGWGYRVRLPGKMPALRPAIHYGMLDLAEGMLRKAIRRLAPFAEEGVPIVILEPSTASVFRDELPQLFPDDEDGKRITPLTFLLGELIEKEDLELPPLAGRAVFHAHCHQKAVLNAEAGRRVLRKMGLDFEEPQPGCCGMAGSFGFEAKHYDISMKIGEEHLLPAVRRADPRTYVVADGFSCRTQIAEGTGRHPMHLSEILLLARQRGEGREALPYPERGVVEQQTPVLSLRTVAAAGVAVGGLAALLQLRKSKAH